MFQLAACSSRGARSLHFSGGWDLSSNLPLTSLIAQLPIALTPSSALLCSSLTMLATTVNLPARRAPSPQIRARDTSLDGTTNCSAGINSAPNVDAGINAATHLGGHRCRHYENRGDSTDDRKLAKHDFVPQLGRLPPPWRRRTNVWRRVTSPTRGAKRLRSGTEYGQRYDAPGSQIDRAPFPGFCLRGEFACCAVAAS
jgi:hypothetical protein